LLIIAIILSLAIDIFDNVFVLWVIAGCTSATCKAKTTAQMFINYFTKTEND